MYREPSCHQTRTCSNVLKRETDAALPNCLGRGFLGRDSHADPCLLLTRHCDHGVAPALRVTQPPTLYLISCSQASAAFCLLSEIPHVHMQQAQQKPRAPEKQKSWSDSSHRMHGDSGTVTGLKLLTSWSHEVRSQRTAFDWILFKTSFTYESSKYSYNNSALSSC